MNRAITKGLHDHHAIKILSEEGTLHGEILLVKGGRRAYLAVNCNQFCTSFAGPATLRKLARAILDEVGE